MRVAAKELVKLKALNGWNLFWLVTGPISVAMLMAMWRADLARPEAISTMIQLSVRCAVPLLYVAFLASSVQVLFPGPVGQWLLRNRKYVGLCFAAAMAWQGFFILWLVIVHSEYYIEEVYVLRDAIEGVTGYAFLAAMTITSFKPGRELLTPRQWRLLHKSGIYFLWAYAFSVYWWELFYYKTPEWIDYVFYWSGFLAWALRAAAWSKKKSKAAAKAPATSTGQPLFLILGVAAIAAGFAAASFGATWYPTAERLLTGYTFTLLPETYLPYWPFEPFLALFVVSLGAYLVTRARA